jgi:hypothetical protein
VELAAANANTKGYYNHFPEAFEAEERDYPDILCKKVNDIKAYVEYLQEKVENNYGRVLKEPEEVRTMVKTAKVTARKAKKGETVDTRVRVERAGMTYTMGETSNVVKEDAWIVVNPDGEEYLVSANKFAQKYQSTEQEGVYEPTPEPRKHITIHEDICFEAPWKDEKGNPILMYALKGAVLDVTGLENGDVYAIQGPALQGFENYNEWQKKQENAGKEQPDVKSKNILDKIKNLVSGKDKPTEQTQQPQPEPEIEK